MGEQKSQLDRVAQNIEHLVLRFFSERILSGGTYFHLSDLSEYVAAETQVAPGSPDRIMRSLRRKGLLDYRVVNRGKSLYQVVPVKQ